MRNQKAQCLDDIAAVLQIKSFIFKNIFGKELSLRDQFVDIAECVPDILTRDAPVFIFVKQLRRNLATASYATSSVTCTLPL